MLPSQSSRGCRAIRRRVRAPAAAGAGAEGAAAATTAAEAATTATTAAEAASSEKLLSAEITTGPVERVQKSDPFADRPPHSADRSHGEERIDIESVFGKSPNRQKL